jgi:Family of unknown function (DUF5343)
MGIEHNGNAPYASPKNVLDVVERYRHRGLRTPFTLDLLGQIGVPDGAAHRTLQAFKLLDLVTEDGQPTEALEALKRASEEEYRPLLAQILRAAYHNIFTVVDPASDTPTAVRDAFRFYKPDSQQHRMVTLFLALCEEAGIIEKGPKKRGRVQKAPERSAANGRPASSGRRNPGPPPPPPPPADSDPSRDPAITGVLARLPKTQRWTERERERWFRALEGAVDLVVETTAEPAGAAPDGR